MTEPRRLVNLPGYDDTARDIYETPELTDDTSTTLTQQTSPGSPSETSDTSDDVDDASDEEENEEVGAGGGKRSYGISRRRLYPERARTKFGSVETTSGKRVDLSDRVDGRRKGYRVRRKGQDVGVEGLESRIARLRREVEECRVEAESELDFGGRDTEGERELEGLGRILAGIEVKGRRGVQAQMATGADAGSDGKRVVTPGAWPEMDGDGEVSDEVVLRRVADFDSRLSSLEQALGISALDSATLDAITMPVLPSLTLLDQQVAALASANSLTNLETASAKIQKLKYDAEQLSTFSISTAQPPSRPSSSTTSKSNSNNETLQQPSALSQDDITKLHSLYQLLPTLQSLSPTIPALLTRLRSLRTLHTNAASAASELDEVETRQGEMEKELKAWREGLEKVEEAVAEARETNGRNGSFIQQWVQELEGRVKGLGR